MTEAARELTFRDLAGIGLDRLKGVGEKKLEALHEVGVDSVLDLLTTYPRRWVEIGRAHV